MENMDLKIAKQLYDEYANFCNTHGVEPIPVDSFEDGTIHSDDFKDEEDKHLLGFTPGIAVNAGTFYNVAKHGFNRFRQNRGDIKSTLDALKGDAANYVNDVINDFVGGTSDVKINTNINGGGGNFDNGNKGVNFGNSGDSNSTMINLNRNPVETKFNSGIVPRASYQLELYPSTIYCPLHLTIAEPSFENLESDPTIKNYYEDTAIYEFQKAAQARVNFNVDVSPNGSFGVNTIKRLFNVYFKLLNTIHPCLSIMAYCSDPFNRNDGIRAMRNLMTPNLYNALQIAMETLSGTPIPPGIVGISHWFYGNYNQSSLANSPAIKFLPVSISDPGFATFETKMIQRLSEGLAELKLLRPTTTVLAKVISRDKSWYGVPHYSSEILHDQNFTTLFANSPWASTKGNVKNYDPNEIFAYITYGAQDGGILGMTSKYIVLNTVTKSLGLIKIPDLVNDNRFSYVFGNSKNIFTYSWTDVNVAFGRGEIVTNFVTTDSTQKETNVTTNSFVRTGAEMITDVSWSSIRENQRQMINHIIGWDKMPGGKVKIFDNNNSKKSSKNK